MATIPFSAIYPEGPGTLAANGGGAVADAGNPEYPGMPAGATPVHKDATYTAAGTYTLWQPSAGFKFVCTAVVINTDTAMRVAAVDGADIPGSRVADGNWAANGGLSENGIPTPYVSKTVGAPLLVIVGGAGNVKVEVRGWEKAA